VAHFVTGSIDDHAVEQRTVHGGDLFEAHQRWRNTGMNSR
jgi:hypothetical protein